MSRPDTVTRIAARADRHGLALVAELATSLAAYYDLLRRWNETLNLTALPDAHDAIDRLLIEPVLASRFLPATGSLIDIGSGNGSPAVPLRLAQPGLSLAMVESKTRKAAFLREVARTLALGQTRVHAKRLEDLATEPGLEESADAVSVRAVRADAAFMARCRALLKPGGELFLFTGPGASAPVSEGWANHREHPLIVTLGSHLLVLRKTDVVDVAGREVGGSRIDVARGKRRRARTRVGTIDP